MAAVSPSDRILIVEDEFSIAADLERTLRRLGYTVVGHAASGEQAIEKAATTAPDLVLMDIRLKGTLDGVATAERILAARLVSIVYLTAYVDEETVARAKRTSPFGYLLKPFNEHQLRTTVEMALAKHQAELALHQAHAELEQKV
jgi:CheY-like chemotaxis protein